MSVNLLISYLIGTAKDTLLDEIIEDVVHSIDFDNAMPTSECDFPDFDSTLILCL